jgi:acyl carrier protein
MASVLVTNLDSIVYQVRVIASEQFGLRLDQVRPESRLIEDLNCDSLDMIELIMEIEEQFGISMPDTSEDPIYKAVFTRRPFRIQDFAEIVMHQLQTRRLGQPIEWVFPQSPAPTRCVPFTQCGMLDAPDDDLPLLEPIGCDERGHSMFRRRTDGMRCVMVPEAICEIGHNGAQRDERPQHSACISRFIIDCEPVSVIAFCRFLNSVRVHDDRVLRDWFLTSDDDHRVEHVPVVSVDGAWQPRTARAGEWPMIMVSWHGANAYSRWANRVDWRDYRKRFLFAPGRSTLPSEAQWEYAARGAQYCEYPWGSAEPTTTLAQFGLHRRGHSYAFDDLPIAPVNAALGVSPFGLLHMAGNVWHWCADSYDPDFYTKPEALVRDPLNDAESGNRSERGGSWIGAGVLLRSSYRRGRAPSARGRCLGFRCTSAVIE